MLLDSIPTVEDCNTRPGASRAVPEHVVAHELAEAFPEDSFPTPEEEAAMFADYLRVRAAGSAGPAGYVDVPCVRCGAAIFCPAGATPVCPSCLRGPTPPAGSQFPEVVTWPDTDLIVAIELCEQRAPGLNLHAVGNLPDRHEAFMQAVTAEVLRRIDEKSEAKLVDELSRMDAAALALVVEGADDVEDPLDFGDRRERVLNLAAAELDRRDTARGSKAAA